MRRIACWAVVVWVFASSVAFANDIVVNTTDDEVNSDGDCSLREAVNAANTNIGVDACMNGYGADRIVIPSGVYLLTLGDTTDEDGNAGGDLDLTQGVSLNGAGANLTRIELTHAQGNVIEAVGAIPVEVRGVTLAGMGGPGLNISGVAVGLGGSLVFADSAIVSVSGRTGAFGLYLRGTSHTIERCLFDGFDGSAVLLAQGSALIRNSTFNAFGYDALLVDEGSSINIEHSTFFDATIVHRRDGSSATFRIADSILVAGADPTTSQVTGYLTSGGGNVVSDSPGGFGLGDLTNQTITLGPLQDNGGPTLTRMPASGNPAIGRSACANVDVDQRGFARPESACTSGAVEFSSAVCGNSDVESGEVCDDGNLVSGDGCDSNCTQTACGNDVVSTGEDCDDGNTTDGDGCDANCKPTGCGNGQATSGEDCDDGNLTNNDGCDANCKVTACGNGVTAGTEACDDGNAVNGDACDSNCTIPECGNGIMAGAEICDDANQVNGDGCDINCTESACGNGIASPTEACDDGNATEGDGCDSNCTVSACGNDIKEPDEACDDGNTADGDGCDSNCTATACGNGVATSGETCDDGNQVEGDTCDSNCTVPFCGNGIIAGGEVCDDGNAASGDGCDTNCKPTGCGNGIVTDGETCDDGNTEPFDGCSPVCQAEPSIFRTVPFTGEKGDCPDGGIRIDQGHDKNGDNQLADEEVVSSQYICHGSPGPEGEPGDRGQPGPKGDPGADGFSVASRIVQLEPGEDECPAGGTRLEVGRDANRDQKLSDAEVQYTESICSAQSGGVVFDLDTIDVGDDGCADGGFRLRVGRDLGAGDHASNGKLDDDEVDSENPVCLPPATFTTAGGSTSGDCSVHPASPASRGSLQSLWLLGLAIATIWKRRRRPKTRA